MSTLSPISHIGRISGTEQILWNLRAHPELWNLNAERTSKEDSPHREVDDIWVRYASNSSDAAGPHDSVWYPDSDALDVRGAVLDVFTRLGGTKLGGVLITRIPPGKQVYPHVDLGWHARHYEKFAVQIASAPGQRFRFDHNELEPCPGDVYTFDNSRRHWVENPTPYERVTLIICMRRV